MELFLKWPQTGEPKKFRKLLYSRQLFTLIEHTVPSWRYLLGFTDYTTQLFTIFYCRLQESGLQSFHYSRF
jgi:hypothetical protein